MAGGIKIVMVGLEKFADETKKTRPRMRRAVGAGCYGAANNVMATALPLTPLDFGALRGSGYVTMPEEDGGRVTVEIGYGGPAAGYAEIIHEDTSPKKFQEPGTGPKFLQRALDRASGTLRAEIAELAARAFAENRGPRRNPKTPTDPGQGGHGSRPGIGKK